MTNDPFTAAILDQFRGALDLPYGEFVERFYIPASSVAVMATIDIPTDPEEFPKLNVTISYAGDDQRAFRRAAELAYSENRRQRKRGWRLMHRMMREAR